MSTIPRTCDARMGTVVLSRLENIRPHSMEFSQMVSHKF